MIKYDAESYIGGLNGGGAPESYKGECKITRLIIGASGIAVYKGKKFKGASL